MENNKVCVWATRKSLWDSFLNDPELTQAIDQLRNNDRHQSEADKGASASLAASQSSVHDLENDVAGDPQCDDKETHNIGARLKAYETPITDEILRQSIR